MKNIIAISIVLLVLSLCSCRKNNTDSVQPSNAQTEVPDTIETMHHPENTDSIASPDTTDSTNVSKSEITAEMAYEGVNNYCHKAYDWSVAEDNPSIMYVKMGEESASEYQVIFRSYTGAFVYFYVDKKSGTTRMVEYVPTLDVKDEVGTIDLFDYIEKKK